MKVCSINTPQKLSHIQAKRTLVAALSLGFLFSTLQIITDLYDLRKKSHQTISQVIEIMRETAAQAVFNVNDALAWKVVNGLFQYKPIYLARIIDDELKVNMAQLERPKTGGGISRLAHYILPDETFVIPLHFQEREPPVGHLHIEVDNVIVAWSFFKRTSWVILTGLLRNMFLASLLFLVFHHTLTRPLLELIHNIATLDPNHPSATRVPVDSNHRHNELGLLATTLNQLLVAVVESNRNQQVADQAKQEAEIARIKAEVTSNEKSTFLATMSHEIRTPLSGILCAIEILRRTHLDAEQLYYLDTITSENRALQSIINDVLDISKIESGQFRLSKVSFDIRDLLLELFTLMKPLSEEKKLQLVFNLNKHIHPILLGDRHRLRQVLLNLIDNAIKYTEEGTVSFSMSPHEPQHGGERLEFKIQDSGTGIPNTLFPTLFDPFIQDETSFTRRFKGVGLGLFICKKLVTMMDGVIQVESIEGKGTVFRVILEFQRSPSILTTKREPGHSVVQKEAPVSGTILLIGGDQTHQKLVAELLNLEGYQVTTANDGLQALKRLDELFFDVVLMDIHLPGMDGFETTRRIRALPNENIATTPIIAFSADVLKETISLCQEVGMDEFLPKPLNVAKLNQVLSTYIPSE